MRREVAISLLGKAIGPENTGRLQLSSNAVLGLEARCAFESELFPPFENGA
jgi:hypothetical protein